MSIECSHRPPCPGCPQLNAALSSLSRLAILDDFARNHGAIMESPLVGPDSEFRIRAKLAIRGRARSPKIGIFQAGTHRIVDIPNCPIHHPAINKTVSALKQTMRRHMIQPFFEKAHLGLLRYAQVVVQRSTGAVQITLVVTDLSASELDNFCADLIKTMGIRLHSLWLNLHAGKGNEVFGKEFRHVFGPMFLAENIASQNVHFHPGSFGQSNLDLAEKMTQWILGHIPNGQRILEFHCGVGAIGLGLIPGAAALVANEISPLGIAGLELGIRGLGDLGSKVEIVKGPATSAISYIDRSDVILCDPPRKGMEPELIRALSQSNCDQMWLVYCGFESFLRDAQSILEPGNLTLKKIRPVHLFPHTDHIEVVAQFQSKE